MPVRVLYARVLDARVNCDSDVHCGKVKKFVEGEPCHNVRKSLALKVSCSEPPLPPNISSNVSFVFDFGQVGYISFDLFDIPVPA
jgi:hypothetical protein